MSLAKPRRAVFLVSGGVISAKIISAWISTGNSVAGLCVGGKPQRLLNQQQALGLLAPSWSIAAIVERQKFPVLANARLSDRWELISWIRALGADVLITAMTHQIVPQAILREFSSRAVNFHPALLPHYRGPNPRSGLILDGKASLYGGVTLHELSRKIDTGDIIGSRPVPYDPARGFINWDVRQARAAADLVCTELQAYLDGSRVAEPQPVSSGNYRKVLPSEITLSGQTSADHARWLCDHLGPSGWVRFRPEIRDGDSPEYAVCRFLGRIGLPTGKEARVDQRTVEFDAADARVRLGRLCQWTRVVKVGTYLAAIAATSSLRYRRSAEHARA